MRIIIGDCEGNYIDTLENATYQDIINLINKYNCKITIEDGKDFSIPYDKIETYDYIVYLERNI